MPRVLNMPVVTQGSVENGLPYSSGSQYTRAWIYKGCEYVKVIQGYSYKGFWIKFFIVYMSEFIKKKRYIMFDMSQES